MGACQSTSHAVDVTTRTKNKHTSSNLVPPGGGASGNENSPSDHTTESRSADSVTTGTLRTLNVPTLHRRHDSAVGLDDMIQQRKTEGNFVSNVVHIEAKSGRRIEQVYDGVHDGKELGTGIAGRVRLVTHRQTGISYAVKCLELRRVIASKDTLNALRNEITIMAQLDHPNIARLQEVYEDEEQIYLVQELGSGGELFDVLDEQPDYHYGEAEAVKLMFQILSSLRYLHSKGIVHRDLKLENFLFSTNRHKQLKMIDFGLSKHFHRGDVQHEQVGTPYTIAPEVIVGTYDEKCDLWSIGVVAFMLLSGETPFGGCGDSVGLLDLRTNITQHRFRLDPEQALASNSKEAKNFVLTMLASDPSKRPSAEQALRHPWIQAYHESTTEDAVVQSELINYLIAFKDLHVTKRLMMEVISFSAIPEQIRDLRVEFEKLDTDGLGEISLECMLTVLPRTPLPDRGNSNGYRTLSTHEIEEIFIAMKVGKSEPRVHWHEFVAACLPACRVDERNLRIAFDRLDQDHTGFITFEDVIQVIARDADEDEAVLRTAWKESLHECHCPAGRSQLNFQEFSQLVQQHI